MPARVLAPAVSADLERSDLALLTGSAAGDLLAAVLAAEGVRLTAWAVHLVHHRPGVGVTVGWTLSWQGAEPEPEPEPASGPGSAATVRSRGDEYLLGTTAAVPAGTPGSTTATLDGRPVTVWRHPADPVLPGLARVSDAASAVAVATPPGADGPGSATPAPDAPQPTLELVTYRPLRRAVLRTTTGTTTGTTTRYLKVVRPRTAPDLVRRHALLLEAGLPVAPVRDAGDGVLVLGELRGTRLTDVLAADGAAHLDPRVVVDLLDRFPDGLLGLPRRRAWAEHAQRYAEAAAAALPDRAHELRLLGHEVASLVGRSDPGPVVPTHGDLHDANLLLDPTGRAVVGLLDVDSAGPGHRVDDLACLLGHLAVLPVLAPEVHHHVPATLARWLAAADAAVDPVALRARVAGVVLSLVAGWREDDERTGDATARVALVEAWVQAAADLRELSPPGPRRLMTPAEAGDVGPATAPERGGHP
ncbi:phosphotransferase [Actinotalea sp. AC32]|nr:phosphotransferase [Actinotalea sp. AC32]